MKCIIIIVIVIILIILKGLSVADVTHKSWQWNTHTHCKRRWHHHAISDFSPPSSLLFFLCSLPLGSITYWQSDSDRVCVCVLHYWSSPSAPQHTPESNLHPHWLPAHQASLPDSPPPSADWTTLGCSLGMHDDAGWGHAADRRGWCHLAWALWLVQNDPQTRG